MIMAAAPDSCNPEPQFILSEPLKSGTADKTADKRKRLLIKPLINEKIADKSLVNRKRLYSFAENIHL
jgi:hypothetical protein